MNSSTNLTAEPTGQLSKSADALLDSLVFSDGEALSINLNKEFIMNLSLNTYTSLYNKLKVIKKHLSVDARVTFTVIDDRLCFDIDDQGATIDDWFKALAQAAELHGYPVPVVV
jgi:hypothetical protein